MRQKVDGGYQGLGGEGNGKLVFNGYGVSVWEDKVLEMDGSDVCMTTRVCLASLNQILTNGQNSKFYIMYILP